MTVASCRASGSGSRVRLDVLAASSLEDVFDALEEDFEVAHPNIDLEFSFGASPELVAAIDTGASADLIAVADAAILDDLVADGALVGRPQIFATNRMEIVVANGNPKGIRTINDLARDDLVIVVCDDEVPCGKYTKQVLTTAGVTVSAASYEVNVKGVLGKVVLGEADAGIVYATDVLVARSTTDGVAIPEALNVRAEYPVAIVANSPRGAQAELFIEFLLGEAGRNVLTSYGFATA